MHFEEVGFQKKIRVFNLDWKHKNIDLVKVDLQKNSRFWFGKKYENRQTQNSN